MIDRKTPIKDTLINLDERLDRLEAMVDRLYETNYKTRIPRVKYPDLKKTAYEAMKQRALQEKIRVKGVNE
jgi:hypothetical protein